MVALSRKMNLACAFPIYLQANNNRIYSLKSMAQAMHQCS